MNTQLTRGDVYNALKDLFPDSLFNYLLNGAQQALIQNGKWKGAIARVVFNSSVDGYITLPPYYLAVLKAQFACVPVQTFSQFHEYMESGPGELDKNINFIGELVDMGDGFPTQYSIGEAGSIQLYSGGSDNGTVVRIFGINAETGLPVFDNQGNEGEELTLNAPYVQSLYHYSEITGLQKTTTKGNVPIWVLPSSGTPYQIGLMLPFETRPSYRRYKCGTTKQTIRVICMRRFVPVVADTDWVIPGNLRAIKAAMQAIQNEDANNYDVSAPLWDYAYKALNDEAYVLRGGAQPEVAIQTWGWMSPLQAIT